MKMDMDCLRNILLQAEEGFILLPGPTRDWETMGLVEAKPLPSGRYPHIEKYKVEKLIYHSELLAEINFIKLDIFNEVYKINDLTAEGHFFLADIRNNNIWSKTKEISTKIGVGSIKALKDIAVNVATSAIIDYFK